jgi:hypothetical protein
LKYIYKREWHIPDFDITWALDKFVRKKSQCLLMYRKGGDVSYIKQSDFLNKAASS